MTSEPWMEFGSAVIEVEALLRRATSGPPRDLAGIVIHDDEVDRLLAELPGIGESDDAIRRQWHEIDSQLATLRQQFHDSLGGRSRFTNLCRTAALPVHEAEALAVLAMVELHPGLQRLVAYAQDDVTATRPWVGTLTRLLPGEPDAPHAVAEASRLRRAELIAIDGSTPWATQRITLASRVAWALAGDESPDAAMQVGWGLLTPVERRDDDPAPRLLLVHGADRGTRRDAAAHTGRPLLVTSPPATAEAWRALIREASVRGTGIMLEVDEARLVPEISGWIERADHLPWVIASPRPLEVRSLPQAPWREQALARHVAGPAEWAEVFGQAPERGHRLDRDSLHYARIVHDGIGGNVDDAVRRLAAGELDDLATRIESRRGWDDIVLPAQQEQQLRELAARYRHSSTVFDRWGFRTGPSTGTIALFSGPSGTGKTLAAEVVGSDLGLDVFKIDLSAVISKYIGETEKNLSRVLDAAENAQAILFFDEADALFGKRSEVSDAHDRYANVEVAYLLQRIEVFDGMVILATNLRSNMDDAFLRRIHIAIDFREPDERERLRIWEHAFPADAPVEDLDLEWLARQFHITGGNIRNASVAAAFLAAEADRPITMDDVVRALGREFEKLGRLRTQADFGPYHHLVSGGETRGESPGR